MSSGSTLPFTHDITDGPLGFRPGIDTITSASLTIYLRDDVDTSQNEYVRFSFDGGSWTPEQEVGGGLLSLSESFPFNVASLLTDGRLDVRVRATTGDFWFDYSYLDVRGNRGAVKVPGPSVLALCGLSLLFIGVFTRRRRLQA